MDTWIPLVEARDGKFVLSPELLKIVGVTGWGSNLWEVKAFVAHLITHFEDGFEHFLDNPDDEYPYFHVSEAFCAHLAETYKKEFLPVDADWHRRLAEAKLLSLRVPRQLVVDAMLADHQTHYPEFVVRGMIEIPSLAGTPISEALSQELSGALAKPPAELWATVERVAQELMSAGLLSHNDLFAIFSVWDETEYEHLTGVSRP